MAAREDYSDLVAQAEKAVSGVKDPELKRIAFQKILDDLLGGAVSLAPRPAGPSKKASTTAKPNRTERGGPQAYVEELVDDGFFKKPKTIANVKAELENRGHHNPLNVTQRPTPKTLSAKDAPATTRQDIRQKADLRLFALVKHGIATGKYCGRQLARRQVGIACTASASRCKEGAKAQTEFGQR